ncbi:hypothetical protein H0H92_003298 [Tricholoma furcatifolium]|nr:hypothetical protein H0H92_003298 [Tricholoma furcatifolium]
MGDINAIAKQFTDFYYQTFDSKNPDSPQSISTISALYRPHSMLTWEGTQILGSEAITEKLVNLPFQKVEHKITTFDAQPSSPSVASIIVSVTGLLVVDDSPNPLQFSQTFQLIPDGASYYMLIDRFIKNIAQPSRRHGTALVIVGVSRAEHPPTQKLVACLDEEKITCELAQASDMNLVILKKRKGKKYKKVHTVDDARAGVPRGFTNGAVREKAFPGLLPRERGEVVQDLPGDVRRHRLDIHKITIYTCMALVV